MRAVSAYLNKLENDPSFHGVFKLIFDHGDKIASEKFENGEIVQTTFAQQKNYILATAKNINQLINYAAGERFVGLKLDNVPEWPIMFWALILAGLNPILIDSRLEPQQTDHLLKQVDAVGIFTNDSNFSVSYCKCYNVDQVIDYNDQKVGYKPLWATHYAICTSGTTASSKVYGFSDATLCNQLRAIPYLNRHYAYLNKPYKSLAFLPFHHIFGLFTVHFLTGVVGGTTVYFKERTPEEILSTCKRHKCTHLHAVPMLWNSLAQGIIRKAKMAGPEMEKKLEKMVKVSLKIQRMFPNRGQALVGKLLTGKIQNALLGCDMRLGVSGGGHILPETLKLINAIGYNMVNGFGMTEIGVTSAETSYKVDDKLSGSTGTPLWNVEYYVSTPEGLKTEGVGELLVRSKYTHDFRYIDGMAHPAEIDEDGLFHTGDIGRLDAAGRLWIEGRVKEVIINESGDNIYPDELEDAFLEIPHCDAICVLGIKQKNKPYEDITLVAHIGNAINDPKKIGELADAFTSMNAPLPVYKKVRTVLIAKEPLPVANGIKVQRQKIKKSVERSLDGYYVLDVRNRALLNDAGTTVKVSSENILDNEELNQIKKEVKNIFGQILTLNPDEIDDTAHFVYDLGGDSLSSLAVFIKAEEKYGVLIHDEEYYGCENVNDLSNLLYSKIKGTETLIGNSKQSKGGEIERIENFEQSREYKAFVLQHKMTEEVGNPFFIPHDSALTDTSVVDGNTVLNFGSYNYLGLSIHPETQKAAKEAIDKYGTSASGSRLIAGEKPIHRELEATIAKWKHTEDSIVLVGGHSTNVTLVGSFCNKNDLILYDSISHNSIAQGCQLSLADTKAFPHNDFDSLERILKSNRDKYEKVLIVVEGVYSMDGDIAPIPEFVRIKKKYGAFLMVDEAHSACVIGKNGGGVDEHFNLDPNDIDIKMGTLSKGLGACGGYIAGRKTLIEYLRYNVPGFVFSVRG